MPGHGPFFEQPHGPFFEQPHGPFFEQPHGPFFEQPHGRFFENARGAPVVTPLARLRKEPRRFGFDAAIRLLQHEARSRDPAGVLRFRSVPSLAQPSADVTIVTVGPLPAVTTSIMGMTGATGVLPRGYSEVLGATLRNRSRALHDFMDMLSHRMVGHFAAAGSKYRLHRSMDLLRYGPAPAKDPVTGVLLALTGYATGGMADRLEAGTDPLLHYAGFFATRPRSADRLEALVSDWCGRPVQVEQFAGAWLNIPPDQRSSLARGRQPGQFGQLGINAAIGIRAWDAQAGIVLHIGPLTLRAFESLLPGRPEFVRLMSLVRAFLGLETNFAINPILAAAEIPAPDLKGNAQLGWNTWMPTQTRRTRDGHEAVFTGN